MIKLKVYILCLATIIVIIPLSSSAVLIFQSEDIKSELFAELTNYNLKKTDSKLSRNKLIENSIKNIEYLKECEQEVLNKNLPVSCYRLSAEKSKNMAIKSSSKLHLLIIQKLNELCEVGLSKMNNISELRNLFKISYIPESCKKSIEIRINDLWYIKLQGAG